ncbi:hypothetical protein [Streptomyces cyanogenus]|uniref:Uncharacterized protein n=1 Tax=Streptomyces cyanogenus TaxID=80860 RepID=A0ABX7U686_STRCY|nr:hypothetical protein [Streptomyces cyanogenus]QTE03126.1 hypothetical protein S1361_37670 [Streptomyces cyanogenus]
MTQKERERRAYGLLRAARKAAAVLHAQCSEHERAEKVREVSWQAAELLGLQPGPVPGDAASQEKLVKAAGELAVLLRAYNWADSDIAVTDLDGAVVVPHVGERAAADGFDALGKLILPEASPEGWASELVTSAAKGNATLEAAVKFGKYLLHPTPLLVLDGFTEIVGQAVHDLNVRRLDACVGDLRTFMQDDCPAVELTSEPIEPGVPPDDIPYRLDRLDDWATYTHAELTVETSNEPDIALGGLG